MTLNSTFNFGKYNGFQVGVIYLLDPGYIDWLLCKTDNYLIDIEDAKAMKVIKAITYDISVARMEYEEITGYLEDFNYDELIYLGLNFYTFSDEANNKNNYKINNANKQKLIRTFYYDETRAFFRGYKPDNIYTYVFEVKCLEFHNTSKNIAYIIFCFDNSKNIIPSLPNKSDCRFASLKYNFWKYSISEMEELVNRNEIIKAKINRGLIELF